MNSENQSSEDELKNVALEATWEIESLSMELVERSKNINEDHKNLFNESMFMKSVAMRIKELNSIIMGALGESNVDIVKLKNRLG